MFKKYHKVHMVGIGGIGMSGIAEVLLTLGLHVSGSDTKSSAVTQRLSRRGARIYRGHEAKHVDGAQVVVVSSAINGTNPEVHAAKRQGIPVVPRAEMLSELMRLKWGIAVAGTHGKTTTTAMIATLLHVAGLDPTMVIGGRVNSLRTNARLGKGEFLVAEADESDRSFLKLSPTISVITNIDPEHLENYENFAALKSAFVEFASKVPFYGAVVACADHPVVRSVLPRISRRVITYGTRDADYVVRAITQEEDRLHFEVVHGETVLGKIELAMAGSHHALNATAAIAVARELEIPFPKIRAALKSFRGVARRFQILSRGDATRPVVVDDYAHHYEEIAATLAAARAGWPDRRLIAVVQPHRYSRLKAHFEKLVSVLGGTDVLIIMKVYPAGEEPLPTWTGEKLWKNVSRIYPKKMTAYASGSEEVLKLLAPWCGPRDLVIFLGAGDVTKTARTFVKSFSKL